MNSQPTKAKAKRRPRHKAHDVKIPRQMRPGDKVAACGRDAKVFRVVDGVVSIVDNQTNRVYNGFRPDRFRYRAGIWIFE